MGFLALPFDASGFGIYPRPELNQRDLGFEEVQHLVCSKNALSQLMVIRREVSTIKCTDKHPLKINQLYSLRPRTEKPPNKSSMRIVVDSESRKRTIGAGDGVPAKKNWFDK